MDTEPHDDILIRPDSIVLIHRPLEIDLGTLIQGMGHYERECYALDAKFVQDTIAEERTVSEMLQSTKPDLSKFVLCSS